MRIFVLGAGATGSLLAQLLERQGHDVWCGDRDLSRARRFLGKKSTIPVTEVNARNLLGIVRAARGCQLIVNASASVFNQIVMRAALRLRAHYLGVIGRLKPGVTLEQAQENVNLLAANYQKAHPTNADAVSKADILHHVWDANYDGDANVVEVYVGYLRRKIDVPFERQSLQTVRGAGYRLTADA